MEFVKTSTSDRLVLRGLMAEPDEKTDTLILHIHGMSGNFWENSFIKEMLNEYPKNNVAFLTVETRGSEIIRWFPTTGRKPRRVGNAYEIFEDSFYDIDAWVSFAKARGYTKIHLQGHSLGCSKIAYYQKRKNTQLIKSLILISPSDMMGLLIEPTNKAEYEALYQKSNTMISSGKGEELLPEMKWAYAMQSADTFINMSLDNKNLAIFNYYSPELGFKTIESIKVPILALSGTNDDGIVNDRESSLKMLKKKAVKCPNFSYEVFDGAEHSFKGFEKEIVREVMRFL